MEKYIIELSEIRGKLLHAIDTKDELYAMMQVNNIDNLLYAMNEENKALQASTDKSKLLLADVSNYKEKYEKCINVIKRFDAGIISMYDL